MTKKQLWIIKIIFGLTLFIIIMYFCKTISLCENIGNSPIILNPTNNDETEVWDNNYNRINPLWVVIPLTLAVGIFDIIHLWEYFEISKIVIKPIIGFFVTNLVDTVDNTSDTTSTSDNTEWEKNWSSDTISNKSEGTNTEWEQDWSSEDDQVLKINQENIPTAENKEISYWDLHYPERSRESDYFSAQDEHLMLTSEPISPFISDKDVKYCIDHNIKPSHIHPDIFSCIKIEFYHKYGYQARHLNINQFIRRGMYYDWWVEKNNGLPFDRREVPSGNITPAVHQEPPIIK